MGYINAFETVYHQELASYVVESYIPSDRVGTVTDVAPIFLFLPPSISRNNNLKLKVNFKNTGEMAGDEVILVYLNDKVSSTTTPVKKLVAFNRVHLRPQEETEVDLTIPNNSMKHKKT